MDIEKMFGLIQKIFPSLPPIDIIQFITMFLLFNHIKKSKKETLDEISNKYISKISSAVEGISTSIIIIKEDLILREVTEQSKLEAIELNLKNSDLFREKLMQKIEKIESVQERHTFIFEGQNSDMYANRMRNIKLWARAFFEDWKKKLHKRVLELDYTKTIKEVFPDFFKLAMDDLIEWTLIFRTKIHPTHMAIIENEVNPKVIEDFAATLQNNVLPELFVMHDDVNFEVKSLSMIIVFLDRISREWEELMELTFRSKRATNDI